jgi:membrane-associated phospholipid phosphatase
MKKETYIRLMDWGTATEQRKNLIIYWNMFVTFVIYAAYPLLMLYLMVSRDMRFWKALLVPGISFVLVSVFRYVYNQERPYIAFNYPSVIKKNKRGKSMPSRHVFSAVIVAMTFYYICPLLSIPVGVCAGLMCVGRVVAGVHYPKDVLVGAVLGIVMGIIGFYAI